MSLEKHLLYAGTPHPPPDAVTLRAGPVSVRYANGDIRYIQVGPREILRRVYAAVRDSHWGTLTPRIHNQQIQQAADSFRVTFDAVHVQDDIDFIWHGTLAGQADGTITFHFDGEARSTFRRSRIGFCVLHPDTLAGQPCEVRHVDDQTETGRFPLHISPHQPFLNIRTITHEVLPGLRAEVRMEGDTFEMEDQRNWTDASYKTYCTPLSRPYPVLVEQGARIQQTVTLRLHGAAPAVEERPGLPLTLNIADRVMPLPGLGLGIASHGEPLAEREIARLKALNLSHLRVDVRLDGGQWRARLQQAQAEAQALGVRLEAALFLGDAAAEELDALRAALDELQPPVARWLVFHEREKSTTARWVDLVRATLGAGGAPIGAGTDYFFTELNRERPPVETADCVAYSLCPQVHAFENVDLIETLPVQGTTVASARLFCAGKPLVIGPVTLKKRRYPNAASPPAPGSLPPQVDVRQMSLLGAAWTLGSIKHLAESGAHSLTYYETTGWRGVMETPGGSPAPEHFRSIPGGVFPLYHVLADVGEFAGGEVILSESSDPLVFNGLVLRKDGRTCVLLANYTPQPLTISLPALWGAAAVRLLDETNAEQAMREPESYRRALGTEQQADAAGLRVTLLPYALARLDVAAR